MEGVEQKFVRIPSESVVLCAESMGLQLRGEVTKMLVEDTSFRVRQIVDIACQFMRHSKRRRLTTEDVDKALHWSSVEPVHGYSTSDVSSSHPPHASRVFPGTDQRVKLTDVAFSSPVDCSSLPHPPTVSAVWLMLEGNPIVNETGDPTVPNGSVIEQKLETSESQWQYLSLLLEAVTGEVEEVRQAALHEIQSSAAIATIVPQLCHFIQDRMGSWILYTPIQLVRLLRLVIAFFKNQYLFLDPYVQGLQSLVQSVIVSPGYIHSSGSVSHWHVRELSAIALAGIIHKCSTGSSSCFKSLQSSFSQQLSQQEVSLPVLYGVILSLCHLGGKSVGEVLLPRMAQLSTHIQSLLDSSLPSGQQNTLRVYSVLLLAAEVLLTSNYNNYSRGTQSIPSLFTSTSSNEASEEYSKMEALLKELEGLTLYEFLVELFGERLVLQLERYAHAQWFPSTDSLVSSLRTHSDPKKAFVLPPDQLQAFIDVSFQRWQAGEGFVSVSQALHQKLWVAGHIHPRLTGRCQPFSIKSYCPPVAGNVLEEGERKRPPLKQSHIMKGRMPSENNKKRKLASTSIGCVTSCIL